MNTDVLIIGAGILGTSLAHHLSKRGMSVLVLEKEFAPGTHASGKNAGMIRQLYRHPQLTEWAMRSIGSWPSQIKEKYFQQTGSVIVGRRKPHHHPHLFREITVQTRSGENLLTQPAVRTASDGLLDSGGYLQELVQRVNKKKATFIYRTEISDLSKIDGLWTASTDGADRYQAPWVVNAAGAWINRFLQSEPSMTVQAQAFSRHLFLVDGWQPGYMPEANCGYYWEENSAWYMRDWDPETRLVSICDKESADPDTFRPNPNICNQVAKTLLSALPDAAEGLSLKRQWHCFRTYTEDQLPIWGEDPDFSKLFWLAAFGGFGMSTSFAATEDAAKHICGEQVEGTEDFSPTRVRDCFLPEQHHALG